MILENVELHKIRNKMITDISQKKIISELTNSKLPSYWTDYFKFKNDTHLSSLSKIELENVIEEEKKKPKPFIDSKKVISDILTKFGSKHIFHRKFNENNYGSNSGQILGMQLYDLMVNDKDLWTYLETKHNDHLYSNATYFK